MVENAGEISVYNQSAVIGIVKVYLETLKKTTGARHKTPNRRTLTIDETTMKDDSKTIYSCNCTVIVIVIVIVIIAPYGVEPLTGALPRAGIV